MTLHKTSLGTASQMLEALSAILDKAKAHAAAKKIDESVFLGARLYPDMLPMSRQVQIACDMLARGAARLAGAEIPKFEDKEASFDDLKARIAAALAFANGLDAAAINASENKDITFPVGPKTMTLTGHAYGARWMLPNLIFHVTTAYAILRHNGVEIGKGDFLGKVA